MHLVNSYRNYSSCGCSPDSGAANKLDIGVGHPRLSTGALCNVDAILGKAEDLTLIYDQLSPGKKADAVEASADAVDPKISQNPLVVSARRDYDSIHSVS